MTQDMIEGNPPFGIEERTARRNESIHFAEAQGESKPQDVEFVLLPGATLPEYSEELASGMDVFALKDIDLVPFKVMRVETGLRLAYLDPNYEIQVRSRSGNTLKKNYIVANEPGTIDASYRGFCDVLLLYIPAFVRTQPAAEFKAEWNYSSYPHIYNDFAYVDTDATRLTPFQIKAGDKIAQFVVAPVIRPKVKSVKEIRNITQRMGTGFGDSGDRSIKEAKLPTLPPPTYSKGESAKEVMDRLDKKFAQ